MPIPLFDIDTPRAGLRDRLVRAATNTIDEGRFILGPEVAAFEREFADYLGVDHVVGVANGTDALTIALRAMGVGPGDDVVVPAFTFYASAESIPPTGARPVFCDVDSADDDGHAGDRARGPDARHEGGHRGPPVRQRRPGP